MSTSKVPIMGDRKSCSVLFRTPKKLTLLEIRDAVDSVLGCDCIEVMQELPSGEFLLQLNNKDNREELMEVGFNVSMCHVPCHPLHGLYTNVSIMGLKAFIEDDKITEVLSPYGEIKSEIIRLKYKKDHPLAGVENGNRLVKMILTKTIPYALKINGSHCRIIHSDQKQICSNCSEEGHSKQRCPTIICHYCTKTGHITRVCTEIGKKIIADLNHKDSNTNNETESQHTDSDCDYENTQDEPAQNDEQNESPDNEQPEHIMESEDDSKQPDKKKTTRQHRHRRRNRRNTAYKNMKKRPRQTSSDEQDGKQPDQRRPRTTYKPNISQARKKPNTTE
ncbi:hypothetical protein QZH41_001885 [Actinostola sp. cb2023]|nr:hypothetical protein QZH41_001885 [Actinostola sp. cb2023]